MSGLKDNSLPASGSTAWYPHYAAVDSDLRGATPGIVQIDSFDDATDAGKLQSAMTYAAAQTYTPWLQLPARNFNVGATTFTMYSGFKLLGAGHAVGPKNLEIASGKYAAGKFTVSSGAGASATFQSTATTYDVSVSNVAFQGGGSSSQIFRSTVNMYACEFNALTGYGLKHFFGSTAEKFLMTQVRFTGHWQVLTQWDTQFHLGGSDNDLWKSGYINIGGGGAVAGAGKYMIDLDSVGKTNVGWIYATCNNGWRGLVVNGAGSNGIQLDGGAYEGMNATTPCDGNVIRVNAGMVSIRDVWCAYAMSTPGATEHGIIEVAGGNVSIDRVHYGRGNLAEAIPVAYQSGGVMSVREFAPDLANASWTGLPRVQSTGGILRSDASVTVL